jgi:hypothetical protein
MVSHTLQPPAPTVDEDLLGARIAPSRHVGQWVAGAAVLVVPAQSVVTNPRFRWGLVGRYLFVTSILNGLWLTVWLTSANPVLRAASFGQDPRRPVRPHRGDRLGHHVPADPVRHVS